MLAELARRDSDLAAASQLGEESRALARRSGDKAVVATATNNLGAVAISRGQYERAETFLLEAVSLFRELGNQRVVAECLQRLAQVAGSRGHAATAARLLGAAVALRNLSIAAQLPDERAEFDRSVATARSGLDAETFESAFVEGETLSAEQAIAVAQTEHDCSVQLAATSTSI